MIATIPIRIAKAYFLLINPNNMKPPVPRSNSNTFGSPFYCFEHLAVNELMGYVTFDTLRYDKNLRLNASDIQPATSTAKFIHFATASKGESIARR